MPDIPTHGRSLRSTITSGGTLTLALIDEPVRAPTGSQVLVG